MVEYSHLELRGNVLEGMVDLGTWIESRQLEV